jgi:hypothetical protein
VQWRSVFFEFPPAIQAVHPWQERLSAYGFAALKSAWIDQLAVMSIGSLRDCRGLAIVVFKSQGEGMAFAETIHQGGLFAQLGNMAWKESARTPGLRKGATC